MNGQYIFHALKINIMNGQYIFHALKINII